MIAKNKAESQSPIDASQHVLICLALGLELNMILAGVIILFGIKVCMIASHLHRLSGDALYIMPCLWMAYVAITFVLALTHMRGLGHGRILIGVDTTIGSIVRQSLMLGVLLPFMSDFAVMKHIHRLSTS